MVRFLSDRRGTAAIEFALLAPVLVLLAIGLADGIRKNLAQIDLDSAATAGAAFARDRGGDPDATIAAMTSAVSRRHHAQVELLVCTEKPAGNRCAGLPAGRYVQVIAKAKVPTLLGSGGTPTLAATTLVRLP